MGRPAFPLNYETYQKEAVGVFDIPTQTNQDAKKVSSSNAGGPN